jgi:hypothetical protein
MGQQPAIVRTIDPEPVPVTPVRSARPSTQAPRTSGPRSTQPAPQVPEPAQPTSAPQPRSPGARVEQVRAEELPVELEIESHRYPPVGEVRVPRMRGLQTQPQRRAHREVTEDTRRRRSRRRRLELEEMGIEPTSHPPAPSPRRRGPTRQEQLEGISPRRQRASPEAFMNETLRRVSKPGHLLHFLVVPRQGPSGEEVTVDWRVTTRVTRSGRLQTGRFHGGEEGPIVQAGHSGAFASGAREQFILEDANENILTGQVIESRGAFSFKPAVIIEGVPVEITSALEWESDGLLPRGTVARSPRVEPPELP